MLNPWYVTGFCDGEAAFTYSRNNNRNFGLYFSIKIRYDDVYTLKQISKFFGIGYIYPVKARPPANRSGSTRKAAFYRVTKAIDLLKIVEHFDGYPLSTKKLKCYKVWREMVMLKNKNFRKPNHAKLNKLANQLSSLNSKNSTISKCLKQ